jgi:RsiW-degrading membrane proteinase PrsW (M82 family)
MVNLLLEIFFNFFPVFIFLFALVILDSFKLLKFQSILSVIFFGGVIALICSILNQWLSSILDQWLMNEYVTNNNGYSRYVAPLVEETAKAILVIILIRTKKVGFVVDSAIFGFAVGAGFAFVENLFYMLNLGDRTLNLWIVRGFGTAVMHGSATAIFAIMSKNITDRFESEKLYYFIPGLSVAIFVHSLFNHFPLSVYQMTLIQLIVLPIFIYIMFKESERKLQRWLDLSLDTDFELYEYITTGNISKTRIGRYLLSLKSKLPGEIVADMLCYMRIYLELALCAKGVLMMHGQGYPVTIDQETKDLFKELKYLEKSIGKTGKLALSTVFRTSTRDLWQLYFLNKK